MKKLITLFTALLTGAVISVVASAQAPVKVVDNADLFSQNEEQTLVSLAEQLVLDHGVDAVIYTTTDALTSDESKAYAEQKFYETNCGVGDNADGILLLIAVGGENGNRQAWFSTHGWAKDALGTYGTDRIIELIRPDLSSEFYYDASEYWLELSDKFLKKAAKGEPYSETNTYRTFFEGLIIVVICFVVGLVIALIVCFVMSASMKTAVPKHTANDYVKQNSFKVTRQRDIFVYSDVTRTKRSDDSSKSGGSSSSSSGGSFGGSGTSF